MAVPVEITRRTMMRPRPDGDDAVGRMVPLTVFDRAATDGYVPAVFAWTAQTAPANAAVVDGLLATVSRFPHLSGRLGVDERGRRCFHLNNAGVLVLEADAAADLADALARPDVSEHIDQLFPKADMYRVDEPLLHVQLTRYRCGGLVIGTACQHLVADGQAMSFFYASWATAVSTGLAVLPSPFIDRTAAVVARSPPSPVFDHRNIEFKGEHNASRSYPVIPMDRIKNLTVHFSEEFVARLKAHVGARCSMFQCLLAHAWKKATAARRLAPEEVTQIRVAVNCRSRAKPLVPTDFFGNMVLWAFPRMRAGELLSSSYAAVVGVIRDAVVGVIRDAVARVDAEYVQSFVDFGEALERSGERLTATAAVAGTAYCPDLEVDSWLGFGFHDLDFGGGPPCAFLPPVLPLEGLMFFVRSCTAKGGVDLFAALHNEHADEFKQVCYSLD